jgi:alkylated DNA nucleotide flippase Atl1
MLIASPREVQALLMRVPEGRVVRFGTLRAQLATRFAADYTCPITTGIFLRIAADAAEEERLLGASALMPWWRVVRDDGALLTKLPGGAAAQARHLAREGHEITHVRGVPRKVADVESAAVVPRVRRAKVPTIGR